MADAPPPPQLPAGWQVESQPDGATRVTPPRRTFSQAVGDLFIGLLVVALLLLLSLHALAAAARASQLPIVLGGVIVFGLIIGWLVVNFVWQLLGREVFVARPGELDIIHSFLFATWHKRHASGLLRVQRFAKGGRFGEKVVLEDGTRTTDITYLRMNDTCDRVVGELLSQLTSFPFRVPEGEMLSATAGAVGSRQ